MDIVYLSELKDGGTLPPSVLCLGNFDGLHIGHAALLYRTAEIKKSLAADHPDIISGVFTFVTPPGNILLDVPPRRITSFEEKCELIDSAGIDRVYAADFIKIKDMPPEDFVRELLAGRLGCLWAVCGYNFRYGAKGSGDAGSLADSLGGRASVVGEVLYHGRSVSSSAVRRAVAAGDMEEAAGMLGRPYSLSAPVVHGEALGRRLGFATANQCFPPGALVPAKGIYASRCLLGAVSYPAVTSVGTRPTFHDTEEVNCETHIIGFEGDIYGHMLKTDFFKFLRPELRFDSPERLAEAIRGDVADATRYFDGDRANIVT